MMGDIVLLKTSEAALCFAVKAKTLYTMAYRKKVSSYKVGSWRMFCLGDLDRAFEHRSYDEKIEILRRQLLHKMALQQKRSKAVRDSR